MPNVTTTTAAVFLPSLWSTETLRATERALVAAGLVKRYDAFVRSRGQDIRIPNISNLSATSKTAGSDVTTQTVTETSVTLNINTWYEASFKIEDMVTVQSNYDLRSEYSEKAKQKSGLLKLCEFGGTLFKETIPSQAQKIWEGVTTMHTEILRDLRYSLNPLVTMGI